MGIEFEKQIDKALKLNQKCREVGLKNSCFAIFMTALTGEERYGLSWAMDIENSSGKPPLLDQTLEEVGLERVATVAPGENIPLGLITDILERPREIIKKGEPETPELAEREVVGRIIFYTFRERKVLNGNEEQGIGHASLIVPPEKLSERNRIRLESKNQYCLIDSALKDGYAIATPEEILNGIKRVDQRFTSEISILVRR